jgi:hypothetical protein
MAFLQIALSISQVFKATIMCLHIQFGVLYTRFGVMGYLYLGVMWFTDVSSLTGKMRSSGINLIPT